MYALSRKVFNKWELLVISIWSINHKALTIPNSTRQNFIYDVQRYPIFFYLLELTSNSYLYILFANITKIHNIEFHNHINKCSEENALQYLEIPERHIITSKAISNLLSCSTPKYLLIFEKKCIKNIQSFKLQPQSTFYSISHPLNFGLKIPNLQYYSYINIL